MSMRVPLLVVLLALVGLFALVPAAHAFLQHQPAVARAFLYSALVISVLAAMLALAMANRCASAQGHGQLASVAGAYLLLPLAMALPLRLALPGSGWGDAWFEMLSAFTTTGASVYPSESLAPSLHLWRAMVGWLGGFFIVLVAGAILAPMNLAGAEVGTGYPAGQMRRGPRSQQAGGQQAGGEAGRRAGRGPGRRWLSGPQVAGADAPARLLREARRLLPAYLALTGILWVALTLAGEAGLNALVLAMGTLSTSGVEAAPFGADFDAGLRGEILLVLFMSLSFSRRLMPTGRGSPAAPPLWRDPELRLAAAIIAAVVAALLSRHLLVEAEAHVASSAGDLVRAFWGAIFTATSFLSTTGYESAWWDAARDWAGLRAPGLMLLGLAIVGGGVGTAAGGVKLLRASALLLQGRRELERIVHPSAVAGGGALRRRLVREGAYMAWVLTMLFSISVAGVMALLTLAGLDFETALVTGVAALTTTGSLADVAAAVPIGYAALPDTAKAVLGAAMILGRLEILALIALAAPATWRR